MVRQYTKDRVLGQEALARLAASDERAWNEFYQIYAPTLRKYAAHKGAVDPEDTVQEVMVRLLSVVRNNGFRMRASREFESYLMTLVRNRVIDEHRRRKARCHDLMVELDEFMVPISPSTYHILELREEAQICARAQVRLMEEWSCGARTKSIYAACVLEGRPIGEVARAFGVPSNTVSQIKRRGLKRINLLVREMS